MASGTANPVLRRAFAAVQQKFHAERARFQ